MNGVRRPAAAGTFYGADPRRLRTEVEDSFTHQLGPGALATVAADGPGRLRGLQCPHAGLVYSGPAAAWCYSEVARDGAPEVVVILGPNHHGLGQAVAVSAAEGWSTPLGEVPIDESARASILAHAPGATADDSAHRFEHSLEIQLPFLQYLFGATVPIVPIALRAVSASMVKSAEALRLWELGQAIADALQGRRGLVIASSDMTHREPAAAAARKDAAVLERVLALDAPGMLRVVDEQDVTTCGPLGVAVMIHAVTAMGAKTARQLAYYTSGDITGDDSEVVGYAAVSVEA